MKTKNSNFEGSYMTQLVEKPTHKPVPSAPFFQTALLRWRNYLFTPVDSLSIALFRIAFGFIMVWEVGRYFSYGWIDRYYTEPTFFFSYIPFVRPWAGNGMHWHFALLGVLAGLIMFGLFYRVAAWLFFFGFTYVFLLDKTQYLNHFYLICLLSLLLAVTPAHRALSLDRLFTKTKPPETIMRWHFWLFRFQVILVYFYGGIAKLNEDWLRGEPLGSWIRDSTDLPLLSTLVNQEWAGITFAIAGLLVDLTVGFLLLWRKTFWFAAVLVVIFNYLNSQIFSIGIFPFMMMASLVLFLPPDFWRKKFLFRFGSKGALLNEGKHGDLPLPTDSAFRQPPNEGKHGDLPLPTDSSVEAHGDAPRVSPFILTRPVWSKRLIFLLINFYILAQLLIPLRHWLYPGDVTWTEEGHRFSWRMKLRDKEAEAIFFTVDPTSGAKQEVRLEDYLTDRQIGKMASRPDMIIQFAHYIAEVETGKTGVRPIVNAKVLASLNNRPYQDLIDPTVNLAAQPINLLPASWIVPFKN
jgi:vitamin K-dependent gamma-carboxylase